MRMPIVVLIAVALSTLSSVRAEQDVQLLVSGKPALGWAFDNGREFPGAKGELEADAEVKHDGRESLRLSGDFTGGGNYVQMSRDVAALNLNLSALSFWIKAPGVSGIGMRLIDGSKQCHQISLHFDPVSDDWRLVTFPVERFFANQGTAEAVKGVAKYEHWGGANDGKWHGKLNLIVLLLGRIGDGKTPLKIWVSGVSASSHTATYSCDFEDAATVPPEWKSEGAISIDPKDAFQGKHALLVQRSAADIEKPCSAEGAKFPVTPGQWTVSCALKSELTSPDSSFNGMVSFEIFDASGKQIETHTVGELFGKHAWQLARKRVEIPKQAAAARFSVRLNKCEGRFWVDALTASSAGSSVRAPVVNRVVFASPQLGNMFHPDDPRTFSITVESYRELTEAERKLSWIVRDYWGAEQTAAGSLVVAAKGKNKNRLVYEGQIDLAGAPLEIGRYYEVHAEVPLGEGDPFKNFAGFVILPEAPNKKFKADQIPFTSRNWDNRFPEYIRLTDRVGIRVAGLWGGWSATPPYKPDAPMYDVCTELNMGVLTGCPSGTIEGHHGGYEKYDEKALREGARNFVATFGKNRPLIIDLGNEPNNKGERLKESVHAYTIVYDEMKKIDPTIIVLATSVPPTEEYFQAGYQNACDAFDFHVYEAPENVREAIKSYQALMKKYNCVKPIWSTEIGLNSQGLTRQHIAGDMIRKFAVFFAAGGANISWFDFLYPDNDAQNFGSSGDAMNIFDSRYCKYAARLDAVTLYNLVNGIGIKKFSTERNYADGIHAVLFRDAEQHAFAVLWKDKGRKDIFVALKDVKAVQAIHIDGRRSALDAEGKGLTLTLNEDPLLLNFDGAADLPDALGEPAVSLSGIPVTMVRGVPATVDVAGTVDAKLVSLLAPLGWKVETTPGTPLRFTITSPETSAVREGEILIRVANAAGGITGELSFRPALSGHLTIDVRPVPAAADGKSAAKILVHNFSADTQTLTWSISLSGERSLIDGQYAAQTATQAFFSEATTGTLTVPAKQEAAVSVPVSGADPIKLYAVTATITDASGGNLTAERMLGGFVAVPKVAAPPSIDGVLDEADWKRAPVQRLDQKQQYFTLDKDVLWKGAADLSATMRYLWDEKFLYVAVDVSDDVFSNTKQDGELWAGDGLQFLIDPKRESSEKSGKYDLGMALGKKGPQAWCFLSGSSSTPVGALTDIVVAAKPREGGMVYELAIPWSRLAPFKPVAGANLGLSMIVNEDDGKGRTGFIGWFGNPHTKQIDTVGDLILMGE